MSDSVYHASITLGSSEYSFQYEDCGRYEKFDEYGAPVLKYGDTCAISSTPQLAASKCIERAIFAVVKNLANDKESIDTSNTVITVYEIESSPDLDCSNAVYGDFHLIQEVRFEDESKFPLDGSKCTEVTVPEEVYEDVELTYLPQIYSSGEIFDTWGESVIQGIHKLVTTGKYPVIEDEFDVERPDADAYRSLPKDMPPSVV